MSQRTLDQRMLGVGTALTDHTITASDVLSFADVGASNAIKRDTVQGVLDLASGGSLQFVSTVVASSDTNIDIDLAPSADETWVIQLTGVRPAADDDAVEMLMSTDGGSSYFGSYIGVGFGLDSGGTERRFGSFDDTSVMMLCVNTSSYMIGNATTEHWSGWIELHQFNNTAAYPYITFHGGYTEGGGVHIACSGSWQSQQTVNVDNVRFQIRGGGAIAEGRFTVHKKVIA